MMTKYVKPINYLFDESKKIQEKKNKQPKNFSWFVLDVNNNSVCLFDVVPLIIQDLKWRNDLDIHNFDNFAKELNHIVMYLFHGRSQFESYLTSNVPCIDKEEVDNLIKKREENPDYFRYCVNLSEGNQIDTAFQIIANWDAFISYMWKHRKELIKYDI